MKRSALLIVIILVLTGVVLTQTSAFTYQGKLTDGGAPASGPFDFTFKLFPVLSGGSQIGSDVLRDDVTVTNGVFTVNLDFGTSPFTTSTGNYLEILIRPGAQTGAYTQLLPRAPITSAPYAVQTIRATTSASADALSASCVGCVTASQIGSVSGGTVQGEIPIAGVPAGSANYIQNQDAVFQSGKFTIDGAGVANVFRAESEFRIGPDRVVFIGVPAGNSTYVGRGSGQSWTGGGLANSFFGAFSGQMNNVGDNNSFFGAASGQTNTDGNNNTAIGASANVVSSSLSYATAIGSDAVVSTSSTIALGRSAGQDTVEIPGALNVTGAATYSGTVGANIFNAATQYDIGGIRVMSVAGFNNFFSGLGAGNVNTGNQNTFVGQNAGLNNTSGADNTFFGLAAGASNTTGGGNAIFGRSAGLQSTGSSNSFFGRFSGFQAAGSGNSFFGDLAGDTITIGSDNTYIGRNSSNVGGGSAGLINSTAIGANAAVSQSDSLVLGSISGVNSATADTSVGIGTTAPQQTLHVNGTEILSTGPLSGFKFRDRGSTSSTDDWVWYSSGNTARFFRAGVGDLLTVQTNGNVGIGTATAGPKLYVVANTANAGDNTARFENFAIGPNASHLHFGSLGDWFIRSAASAGKVVLQDTGGNVGIGTSNPNTKLQVAGGSVYITNPSSLIITSPNGACWFITVNNAGALSTLSVACP